VRVSRLGPGDDPAACQILFASLNQPDDVARVVASVAARPVLTVGESEGFAQRGGIMNFYFAQGAVKIEGNRAAAARAGLSLSAQLLRVIRVVDPADRRRRQ
jgi:hypothetical protein